MSVETKEYIRFERARPGQVREAMARAPIAYVPVGALEWHGEHAALGLDGLKAEHICAAAAQRTGGVLFPTMHWGAFHTIPFPFTFRFGKRSLRCQLRTVLEQLADFGFRAIIVLSGHYPLAQITMLRRECRRVSERCGVAALGIPEQALVTDLGYLGDHAAKWETSLLMAIDPSLVDLPQLPADTGSLGVRAQQHGIYGVCPRQHASVDLGQQTLAAIVDRLAQAANRLLAEGNTAAAEEIYQAHQAAFRHPLAAGRRVLGTDSNWEVVRFAIGNVIRWRHL